MANYVCKLCEGQTDNPQRVCFNCRDKMKLIRLIKAMLIPSYKLKKELEKRQLWELKKAEIEREK